LFGYSDWAMAYEHKIFVKYVFALFSTVHEKYANPKVLENEMV
jgi:hypothetical protein